MRKAYVSPTAVAELTRDVLRDAVRQDLGLLELRVSLLSTVAAIRENNPAQASRDFWAVARDSIEALLDVKRQEAQSSNMPVDLILSISCQNKYVSYVGQYVDLMIEYAHEVIAVDLTNEGDNKPTYV